MQAHLSVAKSDLLGESNKPSVAPFAAKQNNNILIWLKDDDTFDCPLKYNLTSLVEHSLGPSPGGAGKELKFNAIQCNTDDFTKYS